MRFQFFRVAVHSSDPDDLNRFIAAHRVTSIDRQFVSDGANSFWAICVIYESGDPRKISAGFCLNGFVSRPAEFLCEARWQIVNGLRCVSSILQMRLRKLSRQPNFPLTTQW
ncbi:hypothetical protein CGZ80_03550 [Rhodopirellula sp. MGV]|nr:hypothetical protein CGZ80_03550 [Rhodopirellula sp. MGV]PNY36133.1 hypothetical protein C2E31_14450 [Rhodopirellula baltica]